LLFETRDGGNPQFEATWQIAIYLPHFARQFNPIVDFCDTIPVVRGWHTFSWMGGENENAAIQKSWSELKGKYMSTIILIILILLLLGALPTWPYSNGWGYYPSGGLGLIVLIIVILLLMGRI